MQQGKPKRRPRFGLELMIHRLAKVLPPQATCCCFHAYSPCIMPQLHRASQEDIRPGWNLAKLAAVCFFPRPKVVSIAWFLFLANPPSSPQASPQDVTSSSHDPPALVIAYGLHNQSAQQASKRSLEPPAKRTAIFNGPCIQRSKANSMSPPSRPHPRLSWHQAGHTEHTNVKPPDSQTGA